MIVVANPLHFEFKLLYLIENLLSVPRWLTFHLTHISPSHGVWDICDNIFKRFSYAKHLVNNDRVKLMLSFRIWVTVEIYRLMRILEWLNEE